MPPKSTLTVVSWNLLNDLPLNRVAPQSERIHNLSRNIAELPLQPDVIALYEVDGKSNEDNLALKVAAELGYKGCVWAPCGRASEAMAILTLSPEKVTVLELDPEFDRRMVMMIEMCDVAIAANHWSWEPHHPAWRRAQSRKLIDILKPYADAVIIGDLNTLPWGKSRRALQHAGFRHCTASIGRTFPTTNYPKQTIKPWQQPLLRAARGFSLDGVYVKGNLDAECTKFEGDSDHYGLVARLIKNTN